MGDPSGYATKAAVLLAQTWGADTWATPVDTLLPFTSETMTRSFDKLQSEANIGQAAEHAFVHGTEMVAGELTFDLCYGLGTELIGYGMGAAASGVYTMANDLSANVFNLEIEKGAKRYRFYECMVNTLAIVGTIGEQRPMQVTLGLIARRCDPVDTAFPSLTLGSGSDRVYMEHLRLSSNGFQCGDTANALAAGDEIPISSFEFTTENGLQEDGKDSASAYVIQPIRNDFRSCGLKVGMARLTSTTDNFTDWKDTDAILQALATFTESGGDDVIFSLPYMKIDDGADWNVGGAGALDDEVTLKAFRNGPSGSRINSYMSVNDQAQIEFTAV